MQTPGCGFNPETAAGNAGATENVPFAWLYQELRTLAQSHLNSERQGHTLSATALVNEVYVKLHSVQNAGPLLRSDSREHRAQFFTLAARAMRQVLVDHARARGRKKRGGDRERLSGDRALDAATKTGVSLIDPVDVAEALSQLELEHPEAARVVELRFFAGLTEPLVSEILSVSERTVRRHWVFAKAWLHAHLSGEPADD